MKTIYRLKVNCEELNDEKMGDRKPSGIYFLLDLQISTKTY